MNEDALLDALVALLPAELDLLIAKLGVPVAILSGVQAPLATRCTEVLHWATRNDKLAEVGRLVSELGAGGALLAEGAGGVVVSIERLPRTGGVGGEVRLQNCSS